MARSRFGKVLGLGALVGAAAGGLSLLFGGKAKAGTLAASVPPQPLPASALEPPLVAAVPVSKAPLPVKTPSPPMIVATPVPRGASPVKAQPAPPGRGSGSGQGIWVGPSSGKGGTLVGPLTAPTMPSGRGAGPGGAAPGGGIPGGDIYSRVEPTTPSMVVATPVPQVPPLGTAPAGGAMGVPGDSKQVPGYAAKGEQSFGPDEAGTPLALGTKYNFDTQKALPGNTTLPPIVQLTVSGYRWVGDETGAGAYRYILAAPPSMTTTLYGFTDDVLKRNLALGVFKRA